MAYDYQGWLLSTFKTYSVVPPVTVSHPFYEHIVMWYLPLFVPYKSFCQYNPTGDCYFN